MVVGRQDFNVSADNDHHVRSFITLRDTRDRISGQIRVDYIASLVDTLSHGDNTTCNYWAVPMCNFPDGLPQHIACRVLPVERCGQIPKNVPLSLYHIVDMMIGRGDLGPDVLTTGTYLSNATGGVVDPAASGGRAAIDDDPSATSGRAATGGDVAAIRDAASAGTATALVATGGAGHADGRRAVRRAMSVLDDEAEVTETGVQKRARTQKEALTTLRQHTHTRCTQEGEVRAPKRQSQSIQCCALR